MNGIHPTISKPDMYAIWDHIWFVKISVIFYRLSPYDISNCFLKNHFVGLKQKIYYSQFSNRMINVIINKNTFCKLCFKIIMLSCSLYY